MTDLKHLKRQQEQSFLIPVLQACALTATMFALLIFLGFVLPSMIVTAIDQEMDNRSAQAAAVRGGV